MVKRIFILLFLFTAYNSNAQKQSFDIATYIPPAGWKKLVKEQSVQYSKQDNKKGIYCLLTLYKSVEATGNAKDNFDQGWNILVKEPLTVTAAPQMEKAINENGWEAQTGYAAFENDGTKGIAMLVTSSGFSKAVSILILTNSDAYEAEITKFLSSIDFKKPVEKPVIKPVVTTGKFKFTSTNFDNGWVSTVQENWAEVTKGNIKVLLHYPNPNVKPANSDVNVMCEAAWNVLVAPRYSNTQNYQLTPGVLDYQRPYFAQAYLTDNTTGKKLFVALFKKGNTGWIEFICPDKNSFIQAFGLDVNNVNYYSDSDIWDKLIKMNSYNKFAVSATDIAGTGKWSDRFSSNTFYANMYTGASAGMSTYSSSEFFEFSTGQKYKWQLVAANTYAGSTSVGQAKGSGSFKMLNDWQMHFSDIEGKPKTFDVYFSCIKGGRILWMNDAKYPGPGIFTGFSRQ